MRRRSPRRSSSEENRRLRFESDTERASDFFVRLVCVSCSSFSRSCVAVPSPLAALAFAAAFSTTDTDTEDLRAPNNRRDVRFARAAYDAAAVALVVAPDFEFAASGSPEPALSSRMLVERDQREHDAAAATARASGAASSPGPGVAEAADVSVLVKVRTSVVDAVGVPVWSCGRKCG